MSHDADLPRRLARPVEYDRHRVGARLVRDHTRQCLGRVGQAPAQWKPRQSRGPFRRESQRRRHLLGWRNDLAFHSGPQRPKRSLPSGLGPSIAERCVHRADRGQMQALFCARAADVNQASQFGLRLVVRQAAEIAVNPVFACSRGARSNRRARCRAPAALGIAEERVRAATPPRSL